MISCFQTAPGFTTITRTRNIHAKCTALQQIVAQDKAGERILASARGPAKITSLPPGATKSWFYKNNTDFAGHSYGCHDNYLMRRDIAWDRIVAGILPFLVTRQIFVGAGKMGIEAESGQSDPGIYQISQRADFFSVVAEHRHDESASAHQHA